MEERAFNKEIIKKLCDSDYTSYNNKYQTLSDSLDKYLLTICFGTLVFYLSYLGKIDKLNFEYYVPIGFTALSIFTILFNFEFNKGIIRKHIDIAIMQTMLLEEANNIITIENYNDKINSLKKWEGFLTFINMVKYVIVVESVTYSFTSMFFIDNPILGKEIRNYCNYMLSCVFPIVAINIPTKHLKYEVFRKLITL